MTNGEKLQILREFVYLDREIHIELPEKMMRLSKVR